MRRRHFATLLASVALLVLAPVVLAQSLPKAPPEQVGMSA